MFYLTLIFIRYNLDFNLDKPCEPPENLRPVVLGKKKLLSQCHRRSH